MIRTDNIPVATRSAPLVRGGLTLDAHILDDGRLVVSKASVEVSLGVTVDPHHYDVLRFAVGGRPEVGITEGDLTVLAFEFDADEAAMERCDRFLEQLDREPPLSVCVRRLTIAGFAFRAHVLSTEQQVLTLASIEATAIVIPDADRIAFRVLGEPDTVGVEVERFAQIVNEYIANVCANGDLADGGDIRKAFCIEVICEGWSLLSTDEKLAVAATLGMLGKGGSA